MACTQSSMANSKYEYVKQYELSDTLLPSTYLVIRIDGQSFHRFTALHHFHKPNDCRGLQLMNYAAAQVMKQYPEVFLGIGASDEMSLVLPPTSQLYNRRSSKINSSLCSLFTATYTFHWPQFFPHTPLQYPPSFDSRVVCLPTDQSLRDYLSWRQVDYHINNLYNTCYAYLIAEYAAIDCQSTQVVSANNGAAHPRHTPREAEEILRVTNSAAKNELLFTQYGVNYNSEAAVARKGSVLIWKHHCQTSPDTTPHKHAESPAALPADITDVLVVHDDLIGDDFWLQHVGLIPHVSKSEQKRQQKKASSKAKKQAQHTQNAQADRRLVDNAQAADR